MGAATLVAIRKAKMLNSVIILIQVSKQAGILTADPLQTAKNFSWSFFLFFPLVISF